MFEKPIKVSACGKTILVGEHSVMYGHHAIGLALPDIFLKISLSFKKNLNGPIFETKIMGKKINTSLEIFDLLKKSFLKSVSLFNEILDENIIQNLYFEIDSKIPLGGGMGGSAAISVAFVKLCQKLFNSQKNKNEMIEISNQLDGFFHGGSASGIDVNSVFSDGIILFNKESEPKKIILQKEFWISLIDTNERSPTSKMISIVKNNLNTHYKETKKSLDLLGQIALEVAENLNHGDIQKISEKLNEAQTCLEKIGVSTDKTKKLIQKMNSLGALASKLTGAGGGGLVLSIYEKDPTPLLSSLEHDRIYISKVG